MHGTSILPGVVFLDITLRILQQKGYAAADYALENILFSQPVSTSEKIDRELLVDLTLPDGQPGSLRVQSRLYGSHEAFQENMRADILYQSVPKKPDLDIQSLKEKSISTLDMAVLYGWARAEKINHGPKMRCQGQLWIGDGNLLAELALEVPGEHRFYMHPAALDATTIAAFAQTGEAFKEPFIPVTIDRFCSFEPLPQRFVLFSPHKETLSETGEIISSDYDLYDMDGRHCASFTKLTCKRIRHPELITRLLKDKTTSNEVGKAIEETQSQTIISKTHNGDASAAYGEILSDWIADILKVDNKTLPQDVGFYDLGLESRQLLSLAERIEAEMGLATYPTLLFEFSNINSLSEHLQTTYGSPPSFPENNIIKAQEYGEKTASLAKIAWVEDKRSRRSFEGRRKYAVAGLSEVERQKMSHELGQRITLIPVHEKSGSSLSEATNSIDGLLLFSNPSRQTSIAEYLKKTVAWVKHATKAHQSVDILVIERGEEPSPQLLGIAAYLRSVRLETPSLAARALLTSEEDLGLSILMELEKATDQLPLTAGVISHQNHQELMEALVAGSSLEEAIEVPLAKGGVCVISGGGGGIGRLLSDWLRTHLQAQVILLGRKENAPEWLSKEAGPLKPGSVDYYQCDITDDAALEFCLSHVRQTHGAITAVFHAAAVLSNSLHMTIENEQIDEVICPKIDGFRHLDEATAQDELQLFVAFSSLASWRPNVGQGVYGFANAAMDGLAAARNQNPERPGKTICICWPLWADGHMQLSPEEQEAAIERTGLYPLPSPVAFKCLWAAIKAGSTGSAVLYGDQNHIGQWLEQEEKSFKPTKESVSISVDHKQEKEIAIVGLAGRFPGAEDIDSFWQLLCQGHDAVGEIPAERWDHETIYDPDRTAMGKTYGRWGGFLDEIDVFDAAKFHISRRDAERMDPQERLFLETCWTLFEEAGHPASGLEKRDIAVFAGVMWNHYQLCSDRDVAPNALHASIANRVSYAFNLTGPSMALDSACSSSLTAFSLAVDALGNGNCSMAIAGGVNLMVHPEKYRQLAQGQFLSEDGKCRSFGLNGSGYVPGEGVGAVLLRPLEDALKEGDHIWGVVKSCALNHGGRSGGFTIPSPTQQSAVITQALEKADIAPGSIDYVEAHGTGTSLGDPIEIEALGRALGERSEGYLPIGSVKSNIGHLESAAGIAAIAKVLLMLKWQKLVPSLHSQNLNPKLPLDRLAMTIQQDYDAWPKLQNGSALRAAISSFGAGGANAHIILDQPPEMPVESKSVSGPMLLTLSARDDKGLRDYARRLASVLLAHSPTKGDKSVFEFIATHLGVRVEDINPDDTLRSLGIHRDDLVEVQKVLAASHSLDPDVSLSTLSHDKGCQSADENLLARVAYTLQTCRSHLGHRLALVADSVSEAVELLLCFEQVETHGKLFYGLEADPEEITGDIPLEELAKKWAGGGDFDFSKIWEKQGMVKLSLPVPKLNREESFWIGRWQAAEEKASDRVIIKTQSIDKQGSEDMLKESRIDHDIQQLKPTNTESRTEVVSLQMLENGVALVQMQDSEHHNMFTESLLSGLKSSFFEINKNQEIQCVVITGTSKAFSLGGTPDTLEALARKDYSFNKEPFIFEGLQKCRVPVIAAICGHAAGGGLTFGLHADLVILDRQGSYSANFVKFGFTPGVGATYVLERRFGTNLANEMFLTGKTYSGRELEEQGVKLRFEERDQVLKTAINMARAIASNPANVVNTLKKELASRVQEQLPHIIKRELSMHEAVLDKSLVSSIRTKTSREKAPTPQMEIPQQTLSPEIEGEIIAVIEQALANNLFLKPDEIDRKMPFTEMGLDSLGAVEIVRDLNERFDLNLDSVLVYDFPTIDQLVMRVKDEIPHETCDGVEDNVQNNPPQEPEGVKIKLAVEDVSSEHSPEIQASEQQSAACEKLVLKSSDELLSEFNANKPKDEDDMAIIGMSARYPGSGNVDEFWQNLKQGRFCIDEVRPERWDMSGFDDDQKEATKKWAGFVEDIDKFDPTFFGISPREAELMDPQQRIFLEQSWRALEHAGYAIGPDQRINCGIFVGTASGDYLPLLRDRNVADSGQVFLGNSGSVLAGRIAYFLNLKGPTIALDTACSSSLVAVHMACQSIQSGDCSMALAGGIGLMVTPQMYRWNYNSGMLSPKGRCSSFDASADGFVLGEGVGCVVVKSLSKALKDRDHIFAVIKASGINGDGKTNGITAPSSEAQLRLQKRVHKRAKVSLDDIAYIETHGAGTQLGDPIEVKALAGLMAGRSRDVEPCGIGSIKSNIGHTTLASGVAGLMKVILGLKYKVIPPSLHFDNPNPNFDDDLDVLSVVSKSQQWPKGPSGYRFGAVNSFGVSGTNAHMVLKEAPEVDVLKPQIVDDAYLFVVSAKNTAALKKNITALKEDIEHGISLMDASFTLCLGRAIFRKRFAIVARDQRRAIELLQQALDHEKIEGLFNPEDISVQAGESDWQKPLSHAQILSIAHEFCQGKELDFKDFFQNRGGRRVPMQGYALNNRRFWLPDVDDRLPSSPQKKKTVLTAKEGSFYEKIDLNLDWIKDHRVQGQNWLPGATSLHYALELYEGFPVEVSNIEWLKPAQITSEDNLEILRKITDEKSSKIEVLLADHCLWSRANSTKIETMPQQRLDIESLKKNCHREKTQEQFYGQFKQAGIDYGPSYRLIRQVVYNDDIAVAALSTPPDSTSVQLLDAILQTTSVLAEGQGLRVPRRIEQMRVYRPVETSRNVYAQKKGHGLYDLTACDETGLITLEVKGFLLAAVPKSRTKGYVSQWLEKTQVALKNKGQETYIAFSPSRAVDEIEQGHDLLIDLRNAPEDDPKPTLQSLRRLFTILSDKYPEECHLRIVTSGAVAVSDEEKIRPAQAALASMARSASAEHCKWHLTVVDTESYADYSRENVPPVIESYSGINAIREGVWFEKTVCPEELDLSSENPFEEDKVQVIVGGAGGIGFALSKELASISNARLGWIGRSPLNEKIKMQIETVEKLGGKVHYESADLSDPQAIRQAVLMIRKTLGPISGAVHSALALDNMTLHQMTEEQLERVLAPKIDGIQSFYQALEGEPLSHLIIFSSVASFIDAPGQSNYAAASAYIDAYAHNLRLERGVPAFVVNWGYWGSIGIVANAKNKQDMASMGVGSIEPEEGFSWLKHQLQAGIAQAMVINADQQRFEEYGLRLSPEVVSSEPVQKSVVEKHVPPEDREFEIGNVPVPEQQKIVDYVTGIFSQILKLEVEEFDVTETFESYGVDSLIGMDILRKMKEDLGELSSTLLYEYLSIRELADYLLLHKAEELRQKISPIDHGGQKPECEKPQGIQGIQEAYSPQVKSEKRADPPLETIKEREAETPSKPEERLDIAIVGLTGRYPGAENLDIFWQNLQEAKRSISELPEERWDWKPFYDEKPQKNRTYNKWGGFIDGIDLFDAKFFGILPREAAAIDPQERLFLECCWDLLEQAGHNHQQSRQRETGVFVGMMYGAYGQMAAAQGWAKGEFGLGHSPYWSIPNRVSYFFDFSGPSLAIDTACSSSLTAFHLACESIRRGECRQAIAGGINLILHPAHHIALSSMNMLGTGKACRTFDQTADGIIPGEGLGAVLLRPLSDALDDGDEILAIVKGSMLNAGGKTSGYTVPNPNAQAKVIRKALAYSGVSPQDIDCMEVHGTGTQLGDPIEVAALKQVFEAGSRTQPVSISSVKANIGHLEGAAGIAGITKAVLQLKHQEILPCAGLEGINDKIDFGPILRPALEKKNWQTNFNDPEKARLCGVSSFGAGGANAHVILEQGPVLKNEASAIYEEESLFLLSAHTQDQLKKYALKVADWLEINPHVSLSRLCYSSQIGRRHLPVRSAFHASDTTVLLQELRLLAKGSSSANIKLSAGPEQQAIPLGGLADELVKLLMQKRQFKELAEAWTQGIDVDWKKIWRHMPGKTAFPSVPLNRQRFWLPDEETLPHVVNKTSRSSWLYELASEHVIKQRPIVPGSALIEFALQKSSLPAALNHFSWHQALEGNTQSKEPEIVQKGCKISICSQDKIIAGFSVSEADNSISSQGIDLDELRKDCHQNIDKDRFYEQLAQSGFDYGSGLKNLQKIGYCDRLAIAGLELREPLKHGSLARALDGAIQLIILLAGGIEALPVSFEKFVQYSPLSHSLIAIARRNDDTNAYDLMLCDQMGQPLAEIKGLKLMALSPQETQKTLTAPRSTEYLHACERQAARPESGKLPENILLLSTDGPHGMELFHTLRQSPARVITDTEELNPSIKLDAAIVCLSSKLSDHQQKLQEYLVELGRILSLVKEYRSQGKFRLLIVADSEDMCARAIAAASRSLSFEYPWLMATHVTLDGDVSEHELIEELICMSPDQPEILLDKSHRKIRSLEPFQPEVQTTAMVRPGGLYVITGGAGALGRHFAEHLTKTGPVNIALLGRRKASEEFKGWMEQRSVRGSQLLHRAVDIADEAALAAVFTELTDQFGPIRGIIHAAGVQKDGLFASKTPHMIAEILRPKVQGIMTLDTVSKSQPLDFFLLCSSLVSETGNMGQVDYAAANRYLADFAHTRKLKRGHGHCSGKTVSIQWPLWQEGGMAVDSATEKLFEDHFGMVPLPTEAGLEAFDLALRGEYTSFALVQRPENPEKEKPREKKEPNIVVDHGTLKQNIIEDLRIIGAEYLLVEPCHVETDVKLLELGFDSISLTEMVNKINELYQLDLLPSVLFECPTLQDIAAYLVEEHAQEISRCSDVQNEILDHVDPIPDTETVDQPISEPSGHEPVAIIGIAGRFANADNLDEFWKKLLDGQELITKTSEERDALYKDVFTKNIKAGFLNDVAAFDAARFGISPREAVLMDPQQRLFMETVSEAVQDAGYGLNCWCGDDVGIFAGVSTNDYDGLMTDAGIEIEPHMATGIAHSILANRVSHVFDWHGPSEVIDTACSSSLVALNRGVRALRHQECDTAIVGGVNVILSPNLFHAFDRSGMLSADYSCKTFDASANGYVRGEGVGVVVLRPLSKALAHKDHIYAVVKGSAVNHGGKSTSLTAPNPSSQANVIEKAIKDAAIDPRTISYIETHGTGTKLGDHVEIEGLKRAYKTMMEQGDKEIAEPWIQLGAVKTAIGHLEAAAGIAGLLRTILSLKNNFLTANRNHRKTNPHIRLQQTAFSLLKDHGSWKSADRTPLRAGVSSFGFGGTNAHVILESAPERILHESSSSGEISHIFPVSAPSDKQMQKFAAHLRDYIADHERVLEDIAFTLQNRSNEFTNRLVIEASSYDELRHALRMVSEGNLSIFKSSEDDLIQKWLCGESISWPESPGWRCSLPAMPFMRNRYWFEEKNQQIKAIEQEDRVNGYTPYPDDPPTPGHKIRLIDIEGSPAFEESDPESLSAAMISSEIFEEEGVVALRDDHGGNIVETSSPPSASVQGVEHYILSQLSDILLIPAEEIGLESCFSDIGLDSIFRMDLVRLVNQHFETELTGEELYEYDTVSKLAQRLGSCTAAGPMEENPAEALCGFILALTDHELHAQSNFSDAGLTSFDMLKIIAELENIFGSLPKTLLFDYETPQELGAWLNQTYGEGLFWSLEQNAIHPEVKIAGLEDVEFLASGAIVIAKKALIEHPDIDEKVDILAAKWAKEGGLPGRDIAPYIFLGSEDRGYLHFTERDGLLLSWSTAVADRNYDTLLAEWVEWALERGYRPNLLSMKEVRDVGGIAFSSTPFGTVQRLNDIGNFSLKGKPMQRLRQKVSRFGRCGEVVVEEYKIGREKSVDANIVQLIDQWANHKDMVNAYVNTVSAEIAQGIMADQHRVFLTKVDEEIIAAIVITKIPSEKGYLLDLEFYGDKMENGGLDYTIVEIIKILADEDVELFSFGATFGVEIATSSNAHPEVEKTFKELRKTGIFKGDGNFQFKNKYRPENLPIYLCQPSDVSASDISSLLLLIIDPHVEPSKGHGESHRDARYAELIKNGQNPLSLPNSGSNFNLITDSWAERQDSFVHERKYSLLKLEEEGDSDLNAQQSLPFDYIYLAASGRAAEASLLKILNPAKKMILQTNLFPSWLFNAFDLGFSPQIIRSIAGSADVDLDHLDQMLAKYSEKIGLCCIELAPNAKGGLPLSLENVRAVSKRVKAAGIPLIFDATRGLDNAWMIAQQEGRNLWHAAEELFGLANVVTLSLSKDFGLSFGGLIGSNDPGIIEKLQRRIADRGQEIGVSERRMIVAALDDRSWIENAIGARIGQSEKLAQCLKEHGMPVKAAGAHAVLLDIESLCPGYEEAIAAALAWLYEISAIKAAPHLSSGLDETQSCIRLALPVGLGEDQFNQLINQLSRGLQEKREIADLIRLQGKANGPACYGRRENLPEDVLEDIEKKVNIQIVDRNWEIALDWQNDVKRHLISYLDYEVEVFEAGTGSPLVLLHPFNIGGGFFAPQLKELASKHRVIIIHAPGVGLTTYADDLSFKGLSHMVFSTVKSLGIKETFTVAGASFGGLTALSVAHAYPKEVAGLILIGSSHKVGNRKGEVNRLSQVAREDFDILEEANANLSLPRSELEAILQDCESMDPKVGLHYLDVFSKRPDLIKKASKLKVPTLIIHGVHDSVIKLKVAQKLEKAIPDVRLCELENAGHFPSLSSYSEVNPLIADFIRTLARRKRMKT